MDWNELPLDQRHLEEPSGVLEKISTPVVHSAQTVHLPCVKINAISKQTETSFSLDQCHQEVPSGVPEKIFMPVAHSAQTEQLSCAYVNTISKRTETSFHLTHVT
jgi:hypothetical protein